MVVAKKSIAQIDQRSLVRGEPAIFGAGAECSGAALGDSGFFERTEEKILELFIVRCASLPV